MRTQLKKYSMILSYNKSVKKLGKLTIPPGVVPDPHELETVAFLLAYGFDISFIAPRRIQSLRTPDIRMAGIEWEMKMPLGESKTTIFNAMKRGAKQSSHLIIDLRRTSILDERAIKDITVSKERVRSVRRVIIITKDERLIDLA